MPEERRLVTVLFADVVGSTALGEELDAEDIRAMLAAYYAIAKDVINTYGGTVEKFIGDAVMGVFGLPNAHGDDAERALSAALEVRDRVRAERALSDLKLRFGASSGEVVATREPGADFLITGDAVNVAARLQQAAEPWSILAAERTVNAAWASFEVGPVIEVTAKGKSGPVAAREVLAKIEPNLARRGPEAPMRGRDDELEQLALAARRAFRDKRPAFVTIIAPAGTGKTRLLEEFLSRELPGIATGSLVAIAQCLPYGTQMTYWPLRQVLFRLAEVSEEASAETIRGRVRQWLGNPRYGDLLATSIGYGVGEAPDRADVFTAWRAALEKTSASQPLVLVLEDLHWSSESLLDLVDFVVQAHGDAPILMIALSRPELLERRPGWGGGRRNFTNLFLEPLADDDIRALARDLMEGVRGDALDAVVSRAGGNPFYARELVRSLDERGEVVSLPDTVQASIQARLDLLAPEHRRVMQLGSVFGRSFRLTGVVALGPELEPSLGAIVDGLLEQDLVRRDDNDHLTFTHILIRDVTYQGLTRGERARLHAAAGRWLESRSAGRESAVAELVAFHYREAISLLGRQRVVDFDEAEIKRRAVFWLGRAGSAAGAAGANVEASRHFRAAIELAGPDQLPELYERLGDVEQLRAGSIDAYSRSLDLGRAAGRPPADELRVLGGLLMCVMRWAEGVGRLPLETVRQMVDDGRTLLRQVDDARSGAKFLSAASFFPFHAAREGADKTLYMLHVAEHDAQRATDLARSVADWNTWSAALDGLASCLIEGHDWVRCLEVSQIRVGREADLSVLERMDAYHMLSSTSLYMGRTAEADRWIRSAWHLLDYSGHPSVVLGLLGDAIHASVHLGDWQRAVDLGDHALKVWNESHEALGPGRMAFWCGLQVARARRDGNRAAQFSDALMNIALIAPAGPMLSAFARNDMDALADSLRSDWRLGYARVDLIERSLAAMNDAGHAIDAALLDALDQYAETWKAPLVKAQVLRARGDFAASADLSAVTGDLMNEARARIELARAEGSPPDEKWTVVLREAGDIEFLESRQVAV